MKRKILFLIHTLGAGGAEKVLVNLVNNMSRDFDITVMTVIDTGIFKKDLSNNITYKTMFKIPFLNKKNESGSLLNKTSKSKKIMAKFYSFLWRYMPTKLLYRLKIKEKYDIEVAFLEGICAKVIASSNQTSKKFAWMHIDVIEENKSDGVFTSINAAKKVYQKFNKIIAVSEQVRSQFIKKYDIDPNKVIVKYNAINTKEIIQKANQQVNISNTSNFNLITVGRLSYQKGYDRLLSIVKKLKDDHLKFHLWIIGIGPKEQELKQYVNDNQLQSYVDFLGFQANPFPFIKAADLFVCASRAEGFSTAVCEATVLGIPTITTDCSGMRELFQDSKYGLITDNDENALYMGLKSLITNRTKYNHYKMQVEKIKDNFDITNSVMQIEKIFGEE